MASLPSLIARVDSTILNKIFKGESNMLDATSRVALCGFLHDLGKLAERAKVEVSPDTLDSNQQLYCPHHKEFIDAGQVQNLL